MNRSRGAGRERLPLQAVPPYEETVCLTFGCFPARDWCAGKGANGFSRQHIPGPKQPHHSGLFRSAAGYVVAMREFRWNGADIALPIDIFSAVDDERNDGDERANGDVRQSKYRLYRQRKSAAAEFPAHAAGADTVSS